ncbi:MAG: sugar kinase [Actinomycetes bacterium]|nr:sugar kinase [Acidimicrobiia bacterium]
MKRLVTFGEAMIRLTTPVGVPLEATSWFAAPVGGAELNVAIAARRQGMEATWVSTLPASPLGNLVARHAAANGVATVLRRPEEGRVGLYFLEQSVPPRPSRIVYDRADTSFALWPDPAADWKELLDEDTCLVVSGITAALGAAPREATESAIDAARAVGATVALDVNYRSSLWSVEEAFGWIRSVLDRADILSASPQDLARLGLDAPEEEIHRAAVEHFGLQVAVGSTKRGVGRNVRFRLYAATSEETATAEMEAEVLDPVGAGDAMFGTFLATFERQSLDETVRLAAGAMVTAYGLFGDALVADPWDAQQHGGVKR